MSAMNQYAFALNSILGNMLSPTLSNVLSIQTRTYVCLLLHTMNVNARVATAAQIALPTFRYRKETQLNLSLFRL
jgi:hypothetical protein